MQRYATYENFDLEIETHGEGYRAHVIDSPVGQVDWMRFALPFAPGELQRARTLFGGVRHLLDVVDRIALIGVPSRTQNGNWWLIARWCTIPKSAIVGFGIAYSLIG